MTVALRTATTSAARLLAMLVALVLAPVLALAVPRSATVAVVGAPGSSTAAMLDLVVRAGGGVLRAGGRPNVIVATSPDPAFVRRLYGAGAWLVLDPLVTEACLASAS